MKKSVSKKFLHSTTSAPFILESGEENSVRLLDQTNNKKSVDKMLELLAVLGVNVKPDFEEVA